MKIQTIKSTSAAKEHVKKSSMLMKNFNVVSHAAMMEREKFLIETLLEEAKRDMSDFMMPTRENNEIATETAAPRHPVVLPIAKKPEYCIWRDWRTLWSI